MVGRIPVFRYLESADADEVGYTLRTASLMTNAEYQLHGNLPDYALFGIRYLLVPADAAVPPEASFVARRGHYALWELPGDAYIQVVETVGVIRENRGDISESAASFMRSALHVRGGYQAVDFAGAGDPGQGGKPATASTAVAAGTVIAQTADLGRGAAWARVRASRDAVVLLHASFDPGWKVTVDGMPRPAKMVSPALVGVAVGPGTHVIVFRYVGFGYYGQLAVICLAVLLAAALLDRSGRPAPASASRSGRDLEVV